MTGINSSNRIIRKRDDERARRFLRSIVPDTRAADAERQEMLSSIGRKAVAAESARLRQVMRLASERAQQARDASKPIDELHDELHVVTRDDSDNQRASDHDAAATPPTDSVVVTRRGAIATLAQAPRETQWLRHLLMRKEERKQQCAALIQVYVLKWLYKPHGGMHKRSMRELLLEE